MDAEGWAYDGAWRADRWWAVSDRETFWETIAVAAKTAGAAPAHQKAGINISEKHYETFMPEETREGLMARMGISEKDVDDYVDGDWRLELWRKTPPSQTTTEILMHARGLPDGQKEIDPSGILWMGNEIDRLRLQNLKLREVKRVAGWAELLMREVAPEVAAEMRKAIKGAE